MDNTTVTPADLARLHNTIRRRFAQACHRRNLPCDWRRVHVGWDKLPGSGHRAYRASYEHADGSTSEAWWGIAEDGRLSRLPSLVAPAQWGRRG